MLGQLAHVNGANDFVENPLRLVHELVGQLLAELFEHVAIRAHYAFSNGKLGFELWIIGSEFDASGRFNEMKQVALLHSQSLKDFLRQHDPS